MSLSILYVGALSGTSLHRARALEALGNRVRLIDTAAPADPWRTLLYRIGNRLRRPPDLGGANRAILRAVGAEGFDVVWIDKGLSIRPATLRRLKSLAPRSLVVSYSPDDMTSSIWNSHRYLGCLPLFDLNVTTKSYNVTELPERGARNMMFVDNAFDPDAHRPFELTTEDRSRLGCDVGFVGFFERDRAGQMLKLARSGVSVAVRGPAWDRFPEADPKLDVRQEYLGGPDYARAICATRINLGFLRKGARDLQTTRSVEIPACGGFLLAERTDEHRQLFEEGREAEFFGSFEELLEKCRYYLANETERAAIAAAGRRRCLESDYSNEGRMRQVLNRVEMLRESADESLAAEGAV